MYAIAVVLARVVHGDHVGVLDARRRARLRQEAPAHVLVVEQLGRDHLQRHDALEADLDGPVDDAHPAAADERLDPVAGHDHAGSELPHPRCISEPRHLGNSAEPLADRVRMPRRGPEQAPARDPPPDWAPPSPRGPATTAGPLGAADRYPPAHRRASPHLRHGPPQPGHRLDRLRRRLRRADGPRSTRTTSTCPVRLGELNTQTRWVLERAGAPEPDFLPHVMLRVRTSCASTSRTPPDGEPVREVGRLMAREDLDLVPIVDAGGALAGVMTERALARRYIRESREPSELDAPTRVSAIVEVLQGELIWPATDAEVSGQIWCMAMDVGALPREIGPGDVVVVGNRDDAQRAAIELGVGLLVTSNGTRAAATRSLALAAERGIPVVCSPLDSYVTARMITLSAPCRALMDPRAADRAPGRPALRRRRRGQGGPLPRGGRRRRAPAPDRARDPHGPGQPARRGACCWSTTPSRRRACRASSRPRSSRSSTTTTSARSRRPCPCARRSTRSARPRRW